MLTDANLSRLMVLAFTAKVRQMDRASLIPVARSFELLLGVSAVS